MENNIIDLENKRDNLEKLKAAHNVYSKVGRYSNFYVLFCVITPIALSAAKYTFKVEGSIAEMMGLYILVSFIASICLDYKINRQRNLAVRIQQLFDCEVLGLSWNRFLHGKKPSQDEINDNIGSLADCYFINWYDDKIRNLEASVAVLLCQRINLSYDISLRKKLCNGLDVLAIIVTIIIISIAVYTNEGFRNVLMFAVVPIIPLLRWVCVTNLNNKRTLKKCENSISMIDEILGQINERKAVDYNDLHRIQDCIYQHRNCAFKVPDWFYKIMRKKLEEKNYHTISSLINRFRLMQTKND